MKTDDSNSMSNLYHASIYMPEHLRVNASCRVFTSLIWSRHAREAILDDRYGTLLAKDIPLEVNAAEWELVEVESEHSTILKAVYRRQVDGARSLVMVICPEHGTPGVGFVKTVWINLVVDKHRTLDRSKYATN